MKTWKMFWISIIILLLILFATPQAYAEYRIYTTLVDGTSIYLSPGETWPFYQGYSFSLKSISEDKGWVVLKLNDTIIKSAVLTPGETFYYNVTPPESNERVIISLTVSGIYSGEDSDIMTFYPVYQYNNLDLPSATPIPTQGPDNSDNTTNTTTNHADSPGFNILVTVIIICICNILIRKSR
jgi:hypothetical protein